MAKYALITGGTKGIGKAIATCLAKAGYDLLLTYYADTEEELRTTKTACQNHGVNVSILEADISDRQSITDISTFVSSYAIEFDAML